MQPTQDLSRFRARFEALGTTPGNGTLAALRGTALTRFEATGFPTTRHEDWKYTNLKTLRSTAFGAADPAAAGRVDAAAVNEFRFGGLACAHLVFVNGRFAPPLSLVGDLPDGVTVCSLAEALERDPTGVAGRLESRLEADRTPFTALNTALFEDGAFVHVPRGVSVDTVIHVLHLATAEGAPTDAHPRSIFVIEDGASATVVEDFAALAPGAYLTNAVTEIEVGENASLHHHSLVRESDAAFHVGYLDVHLARASRLVSHSVTTGGKLVRNNVHAVLGGEGIDCTLNGLVIGSGDEHIDNQTRIVHAKPHCDSHELYKAILDDRAEGVFNGKIYVEQDAQKTDAKQSNHALLLTREAQINSKPELEIYADDVKCTHGATIGRLDREALFYLRSRGISRNDAENLLTLAFASDVVERISVEPIREQVEKLLYAKLPQAKEIRE